MVLLNPQGSRKRTKVAVSVRKLWLCASLCSAPFLTLPTAAFVQADSSVAAIHKEAEKLIGIADQDKAIDLLTGLTKQQKADAQTYSLLAEAYILDGAGISAEAALNRARGLGADYASVALLLAKSKLLQGEPRLALSTLQGLPVEGIERAKARVIMADAQMALGQFSSARSFYEEAEQLDPENFQPTLGLARIEMQENDLDGARVFALKAEEKAPAKTMVQYTLGLLDRYQGVADQGRARYEKAIELYAGNVLARLELANLEIIAGNLEAAEQQLDVVFANSKDNSQANYLTAIILAQRGQFTEAHSLMNKAVGAIRDYIPGLYVRAMIAFEVGAYELSIDALKRVLLARPANRRARLTLAASYLNIEQPGPALQVLEPMISSGKADPETLTIASAAAAEVGRYEMAERYLAVAKKRAEQAGQESGKVVDGFTTRLALAQFTAGKQAQGISTLAASITNDVSDIERLSVLASLQHQSGDLTGAEASALRLTTAAPARAVGYNLLGTIRFSQRRYDEAYDYYSQAIERRDDYFTAWRNRGLSALNLKRYDEAEADLKRVLAVQPNDARAKAMLGRVYLETDRPEEAVPQFAEARRSFGTSPDLLVDLSIARARAGQTAQAIRDARRALLRIEQRPDLLKRLGELLLDLKEFTIATSPLSRYHAFYPDRSEAAVLYGRALLGSGLYSGAKNTFERALASSDGDKAKEIYWYIFASDVLRGDAEIALQTIDKLDRSMRPGDISPSFVGEAYKNSGQFERAIQEFYASYERSPEPELAYGLAQSLWEAGQQEDAVSLLNREVRRSGGSVRLLSLLGDFQTSKTNHTEAVAAYEKALELGGAEPDLLAKLSLEYLELGRFEASSVAEQAYLIRPNDPYILDVYGWVTLQSVREVSNAISLLERAVQRAPGVAQYRYHLGMAYLAGGRRASGKNALEEALNLSDSFPGAEDARDQLSRLRR